MASCSSHLGVRAGPRHVPFLFAVHAFLELEVVAPETYHFVVGFTALSEYVCM